MMLWMQLLDCWNYMAMALMMLWMSVACVLSVSVKALICLSVLLVRVVSFPSIVSTSSFMVLVKSFSDTSGEEAATLLIAWALG